MRELVFDVIREEDGGYCAEAIGEGIFTQGDTWEELRAMVLEAPTAVRLHLRRDEVLKVA